jgi:hypothetical protein
MKFFKCLSYRNYNRKIKNTNTTFRMFIHNYNITLKYVQSPGDVRFSSVSHIRYVDLFSFIKWNFSSQKCASEKKAAFCRRFGYLSIGSH